MGMSDEALKMINAALARTSNNQITSLTDGSTEAEIMAANYEEIVWEVLSSYPWSFAKKEQELNKLNETTTAEWEYVYQAPEDMLEIARVYQNGQSVPYEKNRNKIFTNVLNTETPVYAEYIVRIDETEWPGQFRAIVIEKLESLAQRALNEEYNVADALDRGADITARMAKNRDATTNRTPRRLRTSRLVRIRQSGPRFTS